MNVNSQNDQISGFEMYDFYSICLLTKLLGHGIMVNFARQDRGRATEYTTKGAVCQ